MIDFPILKRRDGANFRYSLSFVDSANIAILEIDRGDPSDPSAKREPTRRLCVANVAHLEELQDWCDKWNAYNESEQAAWPANVLVDFDAQNQ